MMLILILHTTPPKAQQSRNQTSSEKGLKQTLCGNDTEWLVEAAPPTWAAQGDCRTHSRSYKARTFESRNAIGGLTYNTETLR